MEGFSSTAKCSDSEDSGPRGSLYKQVKTQLMLQELTISKLKETLQGSGEGGYLQELKSRKAELVREAANYREFVQQMAGEIVDSEHALMEATEGAAQAEVQKGHVARENADLKEEQCELEFSVKRLKRMLLLQFSSGLAYE